MVVVEFSATPLRDIDHLVPEGSPDSVNVTPNDLSVNVMAFSVRPPDQR